MSFKKRQVLQNYLLYLFSFKRMFSQMISVPKTIVKNNNSRKYIFIRQKIVINILGKIFFDYKECGFSNLRNNTKMKKEMIINMLCNIYL